MIVYCESVRHICLHSGRSPHPKKAEKYRSDVQARGRNAASTQALGHRADLVRSEEHNPGQPSEFYPRYHKSLPSHRSRVPPLPQLSKMELIRLRTREMRERREKKREGSAETQVPLPELPKPEVEVEGLLSEKKRQMIWTVVALAEQEAYREDWGNEELDEYLRTLYPIDYIYR